MAAGHSCQTHSGTVLLSQHLSSSNLQKQPGSPSRFKRVSNAHAVPDLVSIVAVLLVCCVHQLFTQFQSSVSGLQFQSWIEPSTCIISSRIVSITFKGKCASCNQKAPTATASEHTKSLWGLFHSSSSQISGFCWNVSRNAVELELSSAEAASASSFAAAAVSDRPAAHVPTAGNHGHNS